jgi:TRAP-type C4-dicarboxylate transport system permease small subunit
MSKKQHANEIQRSSSWWVSMARYYAVAMSAIAVVLMSGIVIIMNVEIIYRYVLNDSLIWAEAVCCYLMVWMTFLLLGPAFQRGEFIAVEFIVKKLPPFPRLVSVCLAYGTSILFLAAISDYSYHFAALNSTQTVPALDFIWSAIKGYTASSGISMFWIYVSVPVGCGILAVQMGLALVAEFIAYLQGHSPELTPDN